MKYIKTRESMHKETTQDNGPSLRALMQKDLVRNAAHNARPSENDEESPSGYAGEIIEETEQKAISQTEYLAQSRIDTYVKGGPRTKAADQAGRLTGRQERESFHRLSGAKRENKVADRISEIIHRMAATAGNEAKDLLSLLASVSAVPLIIVLMLSAVLFGIQGGNGTVVPIVEVAESQVGNVGGEPYWSWYGYESRVEWCSCFVSWCANECGYIESGLVPKHAGPPVAVEFYKDRDQWLPGSIEPAPGMLIFFDWDNKGLAKDQDGYADHIGIVQRVEDGWVWTIEGNTSDSVAYRRYEVGHYEILGYGLIR